MPATPTAQRYVKELEVHRSPEQREKLDANSRPVEASTERATSLSEYEKGRKVPSRESAGLRSRRVRGFSDGFSTTLGE
jgi:hypothetical protein